MKKLLLILTSIFTILLTSINNLNTTQASNKDTIVTTFYPIYEFTKQIVGDQADVELLIPAGTEVHGFEPSTKDMAKIQEASVFVYQDPNMEMWVDKVLETTKKDSNSVIKSTQNLVLLPGQEEEHHDHDHAGEHHHHAFDPHLWLSPYRSIKMVENIRNGLINKYPDKKEVFEKNASEYINKLTALDNEYKEKLSNAKQKHFVTQHTAFSYLALDYGLKQVSITGLNADTDPSISRLKELTSYIKDNEIKYIYFEENAKKSVAETLAKETGVELSVLNPLESLTKEQADSGKDYISIMKDNLANLEKTTSQEGKDIKPENGEDTTKTVYNGYFEDSQVKDRELSDYEGEWQSVYPYLKDGTLDQVFDIKSKKTKSMTAQEYKEYYDIGYKTDVEKIVIKGNTMEFFQNGQSKKFEYKYSGHKVLTYKKGNRGVRFLFESTDPNAGQFKYIQFSDHNVAPVKTGHFHIYMGGESHEKLFDELENWPTYYPSKFSSFEIAQEMVAH
ncbi:MAG: ZinT/AdcA family metal-binding protein [Gemella sp.]|nr:ZinT/AdcA family metal-binding protein [Gemella sp.]